MPGITILKKWEFRDTISCFLSMPFSLTLTSFFYTLDLFLSLYSFPQLYFSFSQLTNVIIRHIKSLDIDYFALWFLARIFNRASYFNRQIKKISNGLNHYLPLSTYTNHHLKPCIFASVSLLLIVSLISFAFWANHDLHCLDEQTANSQIYLCFQTGISINPK